MFDFIGDLISGIGRAISGAIGGDFGGPRLPFVPPSLPRLIIVGIPPPEDPVDDAAGPTIEQIIQERRFRTNQVTPGLDVFEGETSLVDLFPDDPGLATFEPDPLAIPDPGTAAETVTPPTMPIIPVIGGIAGRILPPLLTGTAFGAGTFVGDALAGLIGTGAGGTSVAVPAPATTPSVGVIDVGGELTGPNGQRPPTIAEIRTGILKSIGAQHGRRSFSYNVARRILRDLGEVAGAQCLGISGAAACFLLIHPPKRRGRQITPKQIRRAMGAYNRVKALNKSVRKTLGPGCKL